jgi:HPt (histidine-containing phosphotransfer) domain-containing protein
MSRNQICDLDEALARVDHDRDILQTMAELFVMHGPKDLAEIKAALEVRDVTTVTRAAHRLKGALAQFCAPVVFEKANTLEQAGKAGDVKSAVDVCAELETELFRLVAALRQALAKGLAA